MSRQVRVFGWAAVLLFLSAGFAGAQLFTVSAYYSTFNLTGTFEYDGASFSNWSLMSEVGGGFTYTPTSSFIVSSNFFGLSTNIGPFNLALRENANQRELWLRFETSLVDLGPGESTNMPSGAPFSGGTYDSWRSGGFIYYNSFTGTATREGGVPEVPEPTSVVLISVGVVLFGLYRRCRPR